MLLSSILVCILLTIFILSDNKSIKSNIKQYQLQDRVLDNLVFDIVHHPWREGTLFDAIITDRK